MEMNQTYQCQIQSVTQSVSLEMVNFIVTIFGTICAAFLIISIHHSTKSRAIDSNGKSFQLAILVMATGKYRNCFEPLVLSALNAIDRDIKVIFFFTSIT